MKRVSDGKEEAEQKPKAKRQKLSDFFEGNDQTVMAPSNVLSEAELGDSSEEQRKATEEIQEEEPKAAEENQEDNEDIFLFEMAVPSDNNLTIPAEIARQYFPTLSFTGEEKTLELEDLDHIWNVSFAYNEDIDGFTNTNDQWQQISNLYNPSVFAPCSILFYIPAFRLHANAAHYWIEFERRTEYQVQNLAPVVFRDEDFLFEVELDASDTRMSRLFLPSEIVHEHFKVIRIPPTQKKKQVAMKFTDAQGKNWYMEIIRYSYKQYMIIKWWGAFVKERGLEAMDAIRFYKPEDPCHMKHFFIAIVKKESRAAYKSNQAGGGIGWIVKGLVLAVVAAWGRLRALVAARGR